MPIIDGKFRSRKEKPFTQVSNIALKDEKLSLKAKGLYALIQVYIDIPNFILYKSYLQKICIEGERAFESGWNELKDNGYLKQYKIRVYEKDNVGKVVVNRFVYEYELLEEPNLEQSAVTSINSNGEIIETKTTKKTNKNDKNVDLHFVPLRNVPPTKHSTYKTPISNNTDSNTPLSLDGNKNSYGKFKKVQLLQKEYDELIQQVGQVVAENYIDDLDTYKESSGNTYESDYATLLRWIKRDKNKKPKSNKSKTIKQQNKFHNFTQHEDKPDNLDELADKKREEFYNKLKNKEK